MEHAGFGSTWAGPAAAVIAERYLTGDLKREHLYKKLVNASFMPEYKRQWEVELRRKGLYREPSKDSVLLSKIEEQLRTVKDADQRSKLLSKKDSILQKIKTSKKR